MRLSSKNMRAQAGDTIVEVLIAMTVASSVLGITYSVMNKNLQIAHANQERSEASKLAQGQLEALRNLNMSVAGRAALATQAATSSTFCIDPTAAVSITSLTAASAPGPSGLVTLGASCSLGFFEYAIVKDAFDPYLYRVYVLWDRITGGRDNVIMTYRI